MLNTLIAKIQKDIHFFELIKESITFFVFKTLGMAVTYGFTLLVTRFLGASAWGSFVLCLTVFQIATVIGRLGLDTALLKFIAQFNAQGKRVTAKNIYLKSLSLVIPFSLFLSVILYFLAPVLSEKVFKKVYLVSYIKLMSFGLVPFILLTINSECLRAFKKIKEYVTFQRLLPFLIALIFLGFCFYLNIKNLKVVVYAYLIGIIITSVLSVILLVSLFPSGGIQEKENINKDKISLRYILSVSFPMLMSSSLGMVMAWTDTIMLGMWRTEKEVGIYNVVVKLSMIISFILTSINSIAAPKFAEFWGRGNIEGLKRIAKQSSALMFWSSLPLFLLFFLFPSYILKIFGKEFVLGSHALMILAVGQFINALCGSVGWVLQMTKYQKFHQNVVLLTTILNIILNYLLIPLYGITGAAIASAASMIFWNIIFSIKVRKVINE